MALTVSSACCLILVKGLFLERGNLLLKKTLFTVTDVYGAV